jgi:hypothetical protein
MAMSPERARAYRRVMHTLDQIGPSKLLEAEQQRIRYAADNLIFSTEVHEDVAAREALEDVGRLCRALVDSGRWEPVGTDRLARDLMACGPARPAELKAA